MVAPGAAKRQLQDVSGVLSACIECNASSDSFSEDFKNGDVICTECGTIQIDHIIHDGQDWSNYAPDHTSFGSIRNKSRVGRPEGMNPFTSLGTRIPKGPRSQFWIQTAEGAYKCDLARAQLIVSSNNRETTFNKVMGMFHDVEYKHGISRSTINYAILFWKQIVETKEVFKGSIRDGLLAACLYHACLETNPRSPKEIAEMMDVAERSLLQGDKILRNRIVGMSSPPSRRTTEAAAGGSMISTLENETSLLISYTQKLNLEYKKYVPRCLELYTQLHNDLGRVGLCSALGGVIYYVVAIEMNSKKPSKKEIGAIVGVSCPTLTKVVKIIGAKMNLQTN